MSGLSIILIPAGIIAALICFRWARMLAAVFLIVTVIYFANRFEAWKDANCVPLSRCVTHTQD